MIDFELLFQQHRTVELLIRQGNLADAKLIQDKLIDHINTLSSARAVNCDTTRAQAEYCELKDVNNKILNMIFHLASQQYSVTINSFHKMTLLSLCIIFSIIIICLIPSKIIQNYRIDRANNALTRIAEIAYIAKNKTGKSLREITGTNCSLCECKTVSDLHGIPYSDNCFNDWVKALFSTLNAASEKPFEAADATGRLLLPDDYIRDPWGAPFLLQENEDSQLGQCADDAIYSAGPDGVFGSASMIEVKIKSSCSSGKF
jgi:hypothetical protein